MCGGAAKVRAAAVAISSSLVTSSSRGSKSSV